MGAARALTERVDPVLRAGVESGDVPGVAAAVADRSGVLYEGAFGHRAWGQGAPMTPDTVVWIASTTKALTSAGALLLVEQGVLELDVPAERYVPALAAVPVLEGWDAEGRPRLRPPRRPITLRHLLTHTSGFSYEFWNADIVRYQQYTGLPPIGTCREAALHTPLVCDPGDRWEYGIGIDWVGKIVEARSGTTLGAFLRDHILEPLGMQDTTFGLTPALRSRMALVHQRTPEGTLVPMAFEMPRAPEFEMGGGSLYSTACDYVRFLRLLLAEGRVDGTQVLLPATVRLTVAPVPGIPRVRALRTVMPSLSHDVEFFPGIPKSWSLSFMVTEAPTSTGRSAGSVAWAGLANTYFWIDLVAGIGGMYVTQIFPFADPKALSLFEAFERAVYQAVRS